MSDMNSHVKPWVEKRSSSTTDPRELSPFTVASFVVVALATAILAAAAGVFFAARHDQAAQMISDGVAERCLMAMRALVPLLLMGLIFGVVGWRNCSIGVGRRAAPLSILLNAVAMVIANGIPVWVWLVQ